MTNRKRKCAACGFEFWSSGEEYCSALCAGTVSPATMLAAARQIARALTTRRTT